MIPAPEGLGVSPYLVPVQLSIVIPSLMVLILSPSGHPLLPPRLVKTVSPVITISPFQLPEVPSPMVIIIASQGPVLSMTLVMVPLAPRPVPNLGLNRGCQEKRGQQD